MADLTPRVVDACGLFCPLPIIRLAEAARSAPPGTTLELVADDRGVREDLPAWCAGQGHALLSLDETADGVLRGRIRTGNRRG